MTHHNKFFVVSLLLCFFMTKDCMSLDQAITQPASLQKHTAFTLPLGTYRHYKGDLYEVIGIGRHTETNEELVFYRCKYYTKEFGNNALWARPLSMFLETIEIEGKQVPRFQFIA